MIRTTTVIPYPSDTQIRELVSLTGNSQICRPLFFDIETTGLSRDNAYIYLIGAVFCDRETSQWQLNQWLIEEESEEPLLLRTFLDFLRPFDCLVQYNGNRFDLPFLENRCKKHEIAEFGKKIPSLDLYELLKPLKGLFQLAHMTQKDLETYLELPDRAYPDGKKCIRLYLAWQMRRSAALEEGILGHNREDLAGLGHVFQLLGSLALRNGTYEPVSAGVDGSAVRFEIRLPCPLPVKCAGHAKDFSVKAEALTAVVTVTMKDQKLRQFYPNYKEYDYLPAEDAAIPKALSQFMDKSLKKSATPETCYTWFPVTDTFLQDRQLQLKYLRHALPYYLALLE